jgi:hypothetical protein
VVREVSKDLLAKVIPGLKYRSDGSDFLAERLAVFL